MLDPELIKQIKEVQIKAGYLANESLAGEYASAFRGIGMEFEEVRDYVPGDDVRAIDWNVTAKMQKPFVKTFREERELTIMLIVDISGSQNFTTRERPKIELAAELTALLAYLAIRNNDKVGLILFSDVIEHYVPPKKGRSHVWNLIRQILNREYSTGKTDIAAALRFMLNVQKKRSTCFLVSDFIADGFEKPLSLAARRHDLTCVPISDRAERELSAAGIVSFQDLETGEVVTIDSSSSAFRDYFHQNHAKHQKHLEEMWRRLKINSFAIQTGTSVVPPLIQYLRRRERRA